MNEITIIKSLEPSESLYGVTSKKVSAFNSTKTFTDTSVEITAEMRQAADDRLQNLVNFTKENLQ